MKISAITCPHCGEDQWLKVRREAAVWAGEPDLWWLQCMACHLEIGLPKGCFEERSRRLHVMRPERFFEHEVNAGGTCPCGPRLERSLGLEWGIEIVVHFDQVVPN